MFNCDFLYIFGQLFSPCVVDVVAFR